MYFGVKVGETSFSSHEFQFVLKDVVGSRLRWIPADSFSVLVHLISIHFKYCIHFILF